MRIKNTKVYGLHESCIRSGYPMRTIEPSPISESFEISVLPDDDYIRSEKLAKNPSGSGHNNFLKGIIVQFDLQYPEYFSPQLQRYHWVDIISSQSKMHTLTSRELTRDDFTSDTWGIAIDAINDTIKKYNKEDGVVLKNAYFNEVLSNLPSGYLKWMGISTNYLQLKTIYFQRKNHKLSEWRFFCEWIEKLPMSELITGIKCTE